MAEVTPINSARFCASGFVLVALALFHAGCARDIHGTAWGWTATNGVQHAMILGFGWVSLTNGPASALDVKAAGLVLDRGISAGFVQRHEISIDPERASNIVVSIRSTPFSMSVRHWDLSPTNLNLWKPIIERNAHEEP